MKQSISSPLILVLATALFGPACGRSKDDRQTSNQSSDPLIPAGFQNTASPEVFQQKNQEARILLQNIQQQFGMDVKESEANDSSLILTQTALKAFIGAKADSHLLSRSLEIEASLAVITRLLSDNKPNSCTAILASVDALYTSLTVAATDAATYSRYDQLQKTAQRLGMTIEERPATVDTALSFHLTGSNQWSGFSLNQELDFSAGANDRYVFVKRASKFTSSISQHDQPEASQTDYGRYTYTATGGLSADLLQKQLIILDKRHAELEMNRNGSGIRGSSHLDIQSRVQGGELPSMTTEMNLDLQGQGLTDEEGYSLYNEKRRFTSQLTKVDANTIRLNLALDSAGVKGEKNLTVEWLLHKDAEGDCSVIHPGQ